jgi:CRP-like cAMP-binding protein
MNILKSIYKSSRLTEKELETITEKHKLITIPKGQFLLTEGQYARGYYCIEKGLLRTYVIDFNGNDITTSFIGEGDIAIDVVSLFHQLPAKESIQALTDVRAWKIEFDHFQDLYHQIPNFNEWGRAWMAQQLFELKQKSTAMIILSAKERYLQIIEKLPQVIKQAPLKYIATYLGITDTSLSRIRKEVSEDRSVK